MLIFIFPWLILSIVVGALGSNRKIGFGWVFVCSLVFSPVIGLIIVLCSDKKSDIEFREKILKTNNLTKLKEASELLEKGFLSREEFDRIKKEVLDGGEKEKAKNQNNIPIQQRNRSESKEVMEKYVGNGLK